MGVIFMNPQHLHILQHSLGVDQYGNGNQYRNHFCTGPGSDDFGACNELCALGFMRDRGPQTLTGGDHYFTVTVAGIAAMMIHSPESPKVTRAKQRYQDYLNADTGISFAEWIKSKKKGAQ